MIKAIFFDLQGVLTKHGQMFSQDLPKAWEPEVKTEETIKRYYDFRLKKKLNKKVFFNGVPKEKQLDFLKLSKPHIGAKSAVKSLSKDYKLFVASNHIEYIFEKELEQLEIKKYFTKLFVSYKLGVAKPNKLFYKKMLSGARVKPSEAIFIDDTKTNLEGAKKLGIITIWINNFTKNPRNKINFKPDFEAHDLREIISIIKSIK